MKDFLLSICLLFLCVNVFAAEETSGNIEQQTGVNSDNTATRDSATPQEALQCFTKLMYSGTSRDSNTKDLARALDLIEPEIISGKKEHKSSILKKAHNLLFLLQTLNYNPDELALTVKDGNNAVLTLEDEDSTLILDFIKTKDSGWIFANSNFNSKSYYDAVDVIENIKKNISEYSDTYIPELSSPLNTLYTFLYGVQNVHGYTIKDAVKALNLSKLDPKVAAGLGSTWAVQAYRMLSFASTVKPEALPNDPKYDGDVVLLLDKDFGMINMELMTDSVTDKKAWKIEYSGSNNINSVYDYYMNQGMLSSIKKMNIPDLPLHIRLDDWFQFHLPSLETKLFGTNLWKYLMIILLILSSYIIMPAVRIIIHPLINMFMRRYSIVSSNITKRFILPFQVSILAYVWLSGIVIITANPGVMSVAIVALNIVICLTITLLVYRFIDSSCSVASDRFSTNLHIITSVLGKVLQLIVIIIAGLYICYVLNINTTNFFAALGIGGFAFALAGKDTIENFFGSIMIIIDRPFRNGDYIIIDGIEGTITQVGVRSTKIRTPADTVVTVPNRKFISSYVENLGMRKWRRYKTTFDILYETDIAKIKEFTTGLTELARLHPDVNKDKTQIYFYSLDTSSLQIFVSVFFRNRGRTEELKARDTFNTEALMLAQRMGVEFAYPTQKLYLQHDKSEQAIAGDAESNHDALMLAREISPYYKEEEE